MKSENVFGANKANPNEHDNDDANQQVESQQTAQASEQQVVDYLNANLDFFSRHPNLLRAIDLQENNQQKNTVSLIQRQVTTLRDQNQELQEKFKDLISTAKNNEHLYKQTKSLIVDIISQASLDDLLLVLKNNISSHYNIDHSKITLFAEHFNSQEHCTVVEKAEADAVIGGMIESKNVICGTMRDNELELIFADNASNIKSAALAPLYFEDEILGVLGLGSSDDKHFQTGSETDLIDFLTSTICISLNRLRQPLDV